MGEKSGLKGIDLGARIPQSGEAHDRYIADMQTGANRQRQHIDTGGGDILAHLPGLHAKAVFRNLCEEFAVDKMHLAIVWRGRVAPNP
jgi:hypothetical protein